MIIIAENFNSSIAKVHTALENRQSAWLLEQALAIRDSGAHYLDVNAGTFIDKEAETLLYLAETVSAAGVPLVLDSPDPAVIGYVLEKISAQGCLLNSITLEADRFKNLVKLAQDYETGLIALLMDGQKMPTNNEQRLEVAEEMVARLREKGLRDENIFLDPMIRPLATDDQAGIQALEIIHALKSAYPAVHVVVGLSNLSFGLPARRFLNRAFLLQGLAVGLDSAILNPLDRDLMDLYQAAMTLGGSDEYCGDYLTRFRPTPLTC